MIFNYSKHGLNAKEKKRERFFEILPGFLSWAILIGMIGLSFWKPLHAAVIIIIFEFYWLLRIFYITLFIVFSYFRLSIEERVDWLKRANEVDHLIVERDKYRVAIAHRSPKEVLSEWIYENEIETLKKSNRFPPRLNEIHHVVILPVIKEGCDILRPGIESIISSDFSAKKILLIIALEERAEEKIKNEVRTLKVKYEQHFLSLLIAEHPQNLKGESRVKGANVTCAAKQAAEFFKTHHIPYEHVIASCFDSDTVVSRNYFACLTYAYMVCPDRERASFQPIPVYHNNIWDAPGFARLLEIGSSFFLLSEVTNPDKLVTFSSHSMSFKALVDIDYWPVDMISDDSAIFWKAFIHYDGDYRVVPMYVTLSMDVVHARTLWRTAVNVYKQKRRWAWGVENFPIVMRAFIRSSSISLKDKLKHGVKLLAGHLAWATWPFLLIFIGWLPALSAKLDYSNSVLYYNAQRISSTIFNLASICLIATIIMSLSLLPKRKEKNSFWKRMVHIFEWLLIPFIGIFFSAMPALDAQTRLMIGKHMEFWVTEKNRKVIGTDDE